MVEISDSLCSLFTAKIKEEDGTFVIEIPSRWDQARGADW